MYIKYDENGNVLKMSGEKLYGENCIDITENMVRLPLSEYKKENFFDIKKQILRKKTKKELQK